MVGDNFFALLQAARLLESSKFQLELFATRNLARAQARVLRVNVPKRRQTAGRRERPTLILSPPSRADDNDENNENNYSSEGLLFSQPRERNSRAAIFCWLLGTHSK